MRMFGVPIETLGAFVLTCAVIEVTPGPNMAYLAVLSAANGRRAGFAATLGIALGLLIVGIAAAFGLAAMIANSRLLYSALRWGGVAYLFWLAWEGWRDALVTPAAATHAAVVDRTVFRHGLMTNLLNPKAAIFYVAVLPTFVDAATRVLGQTLALSVLYVAIATAIHSTIVALAGLVQPFMEAPQRRQMVQRGLSLALAIIAVWFATSTAK
jgi:threonine/homoserine/homoserine lactone efflux protein